MCPVRETDSKNCIELVNDFSDFNLPRYTFEKKSGILQKLLGSLHFFQTDWTLSQPRRLQAGWDVAVSAASTCHGRWGVGRLDSPWFHLKCSEKNRRYTWKIMTGWWFQTFFFSPLFGEDSHFDSYFSDGLKPPTRWRSRICRCVFPYWLRSTSPWCLFTG